MINPEKFMMRRVQCRRKRYGTGHELGVLKNMELGSGWGEDSRDFLRIKYSQRP